MLIKDSAIASPTHEREIAFRSLRPTHLAMDETSGIAGSWAFKAILDYGLGALFLLIFAPVIAATIVLVRLTSKGPGLYRQVRRGKDGKCFSIYKIRTMQHDCERHTGAKWAIAGDPRVTPVGRILRKTHLDELPQLFNVLRGEMSMVGPRPERPEICSQLEREIPGYRRREAMKPGITGLAQCLLPPDTDLEGVRRKLECELRYLEEASLWLDVRVMLATALKMVLVPGPVSFRLLGIPARPRAETPSRERTRVMPGWTGMASA